MSVEWCSRCQQARTLRRSVSCSEEVGSDGQRKRHRTTTYDCPSCGTFVRSEETEESLPSTRARRTSS